MFQTITDFSKKLKIEVNGMTIGSNPTISFFSLDKRQKAAAITLLVLSMIMVSIGTASLAGSNIIETSASWAMLGVGLGISTITVGFMVVNHLSFIRQVSMFLAIQHQNPRFSDINNYPDDFDRSILVPKKFHFFHRKKSISIYGATYAKQASLYGRVFHIEFHRTIDVNNERMLSFS